LMSSRAAAITAANAAAAAAAATVAVLDLPHQARPIQRRYFGLLFSMAAQHWTPFVKMAVAAEDMLVVRLLSTCSSTETQLTIRAVAGEDRRGRLAPAQPATSRPMMGGRCGTR
jgi:hypothetical protein